MGLQLVIGTSGTGKSSYVFDYVTKEAFVNTNKRYFVIVPDQFTMQTQIDMVKRSPSGGIMNIDVLSFSRLAHRIFEETNSEKKMVLDDTGKNLILRKLANELKDEIPYLSGNIDKAGFVHEIKSSICEFMQYGIEVDDLKRMSDYSQKKGALHAKLADLTLLYERFLVYIKDSYITTEESMDILARELKKSEIIKDSIVVFDGFTGFTPVQLKVLRVLFALCEDVYITLTLDEKTLHFDTKQDLFAFTRKSYKDLVKLAREEGIKIYEDKVCSLNGRFEGKADLAHLEKNIFRFPIKKYEGETSHLSMYGAKDVEDEIRWLSSQIRKLVQKGAYYRDIAVVAGDISSYEYQINKSFKHFGIPVYMDKTNRLELNPFIEYTKAVLAMFEDNFSLESVIRFLRSGMTDFSHEQVDKLELYCTKKGIRGLKRYQEFFTDDSEELCLEVNESRELLLNSVSPFVDRKITKNKQIKASEYITALYEFYLKNNCFEKLTKYAAMFESEGDYTRQREYEQIYRIVMELFEQFYGLLGEEALSLSEFIEILEAGFSEIKVGTIPQSVDKVIVGDIERSRLKPVKYLFFIGLNDGAVPKKGDSRSLLSDMEREFLAEGEYELSPTPRQKIFIQRFYLYTNITKPSEKLYMSYTNMASDNTSSRPSYIVPMLMSMFPGCKLETRDESGFDDIYNIYELKMRLCELIRAYGEGSLLAEKQNELWQCMDMLKTAGEEGEKAFIEAMIESSFVKYEDKNLDAMVAGILYGERLSASISRMETFTNCAYSYFLKYGLKLKEKEEYGFEAVDVGNVFHDVLENIGLSLKERGLLWADLTKEVASELVEKALFDASTKQGGILFENSTNKYIYNCMRKAMDRAVDTIGYQLSSGRFNIDELEIKFDRTETLDELNVALDKQEKMVINGRIDRLDTCVFDDKVYVKVTDYKTSGKDLKLMEFYNGHKMQLVVYLGEGMEFIKKKYPDKEAVPAAFLYYGLENEVIKSDKPLTEEDLDKAIRKELKNTGYVCADDVAVRLIDEKLGEVSDSDIIPVKINKDGSFSKNSKVLGVDELKLLVDYAEYKLRNIGNDIIRGKKTMNPIIESNDKDSCTYCAYKNVCGFEKRIDGYELKKEESFSDAEIIERMRKELEEEVEG